MREDRWLSRVLERPVHVVEDDDAVFGEPGFYYAKVPVDDVTRVAALVRLGFDVVDVNVVLRRDASADAGSIPRRVDVVPLLPAHAEAVLGIAASCFRYSRFHLDPAISAPAADRVKREWVRSYVEGRRGVELLAAVEDDVAVGFLAVLDRGGARVIDLVGVAPGAQGRGVGTALVSAFVERHGSEATELRVGTQMANVPSLRLYGTCGFVVDSAAYVLHRHVEPA